MATIQRQAATVDALRARYGDDATFLTRAEVAAVLRTSIPTLERWTLEGRAPRSHLVGRRRLYKLRDVIEFASSGERSAA